MRVQNVSTEIPLPPLKDEDFSKEIEKNDVNFVPFKDEEISKGIGKGDESLVFENGIQSISISGITHITNDKDGLKKIKELKDLIDSINKALMDNKHLPDKIVSDGKITTEINPFL